MNPVSTIRSLPGHVSRTWVIARHAFTQLVRMKVFYFLAFFAVILIASNFFNLPQHQGQKQRESTCSAQSKAGLWAR